MRTILLLLSMTANDATAALPAAGRDPAPKAKCENARSQRVDERQGAVARAKPLADAPLANSYRPLVRFVDCDRPVVLANRIGEKQR